MIKLNTMLRINWRTWDLTQDSNKYNQWYEQCEQCLGSRECSWNRRTFIFVHFAFPVSTASYSFTQFWDTGYSYHQHVGWIETTNSMDLSQHVALQNPNDKALSLFILFSHDLFRSFLDIPPIVRQIKSYTVTGSYGFHQRRHAKRFPHHYYSTWLRNPAPVDRWFIPLFIGFQPSLWWCRISQPSKVGSILRGLTNQAWSEVQEEHLDLKSFLVHDWRLQQSLTGIDHHFLIHSGTSQQSLTGIDRHGFRSEPRNY